MKKRFLSVLCLAVFSVIVFSSCNNANVKDAETIESQKGIYYNKDWNETVGSYQKDVIPDEKTAVSVAKAIFDGMDKSDAAENFVPQSVFYDEQDEIWIVSFWQKQKDSDKINVGQDCSIAMQKKDGKVLRIWFGE